MLVSAYRSQEASDKDVISFLYEFDQHFDFIFDPNNVFNFVVFEKIISLMFCFPPTS